MSDIHITKKLDVFERWEEKEKFLKKHKIYFRTKYVSKKLSYFISSDYVGRFDVLMEDINAKITKKKAQIEKASGDFKEVAKAIHTLNKEAKRQRDHQKYFADELGWDGGSFEYEKPDEEDSVNWISKEYSHPDPYEMSLVNGFNRAENRKKYLYCLKKSALDILLEEINAKPIGFHTFPDCERDYYEIFGFGFHTFESTANENLGAISEVSSEKEKPCFSVMYAQNIVEFFVAKYDKNA